MAPLELNPHSCSYCESLVIDIQRRSAKNARTSDGDMANKGLLFDFELSDVLTGATNGCLFCIWIMNDEVITRDTILVKSPNSLPRHDPYWKVLQALQDSAMWIREYLGEENPSSTIQNMTEETRAQYAHHRLFAADRQSSGNVLDINQIEFFGFWNPETKKLDLRTRHGFSIFADPHDPAARTVKTRAVESHPAAPESLTKIAAWLEDCQQNHRTCQKVSYVMPSRLMAISSEESVTKLHLQDTNPSQSVPFAALSYCWGREQSFKCEEANLDDMKKEILYESLPPTLQDAINLCLELNVAYLWVDSLCIVQDNQQDKTTEIAKMPYIYGNAVFTIAAASAMSVDAGFLVERSVKPDSSSFNMRYRCHDSSIGSVTLFQLDLNDEPLDERGWTLQERLLSPRVIEFGTRQTRWSCRSTDNDQTNADGWRADKEYSSLTASTTELVNFHRIKDLHPKKDYGYLVSRWEAIVKCFTKRNLTDGRDRAQALSGIAEVFGQTLVDQYAAGLWLSTIHAGLLWQVTQESRKLRPAEYQGPSWSWTAVDGCIDFGSFNVNEWRPNLCQAQIVDIQCPLLNEAAPFGAIRMDEGRLILRARTAIGARTASGINHGYRDGRDAFSVAFWGTNGAGLCMASARMHSDAIEADFDEGGESDDGRGSSVTLLEIQSGIKGASWQCRGLVLRGIPGLKDHFRRIGTFDYVTNRNGQADGETEEEWDVRVALEFDWFRHKPYTTVTIH